MERESHGRSRTTWILGAAALGAAAMYLLDPQHGRRRRAIAKDKMYSARLKTRKAAERTARDLTNRARGMVAKTRKMMPQTESQLGTTQMGTTQTSAQSMNSGLNAE